MPSRRSTPGPPSSEPSALSASVSVGARLTLPLSRQLLHLAAGHGARPHRRLRRPRTDRARAHRVRLPRHRRQRRGGWHAREPGPCARRDEAVNVPRSCGCVALEVMVFRPLSSGCLPRFRCALLAKSAPKLNSSYGTGTSAAGPCSTTYGMMRGCASYATHHPLEIARLPPWGVLGRA